MGLSVHTHRWPSVLYVLWVIAVELKRAAPDCLSEPYRLIPSDDPGEDE